MSEKTLIEKLVEVYKIVDHVEKRGTNSAQNYKYVKASDLAHAVRNALADLGVYAEVNLTTERTYSHERKDKGPMYFADVRATITFRSVEGDLLSAITASGLGSGMDAGDKAIFKAQTGAIKYALRNAFLVPDDTDPENEEEDKSPVKATQPAQKPAPVKASTKAAGPPKAEIPSEPLGKSAAQPEETAKSVLPPAVSSALISATETDTVPTEEQTQAIRSRFSLLNKDLGDAGLKASKGQPIGRKVTLYLLHRTGAPAGDKVTYGQWTKFFEEVGAYKDAEGGYKELARIITEFTEEKK